MSDKPTDSPRYNGRLCSRHPELKGLRYYSNHACLQCLREASSERRSEPTVAQARAARRRARDKIRQEEWKKNKAKHDAIRIMCDRRANLAARTSGATSMNETGTPGARWQDYWEQEWVATPEDLRPVGDAWRGPIIPPN